MISSFLFLQSREQWRWEMDHFKQFVLFSQCFHKLSTLKRSKVATGMILSPATKSEISQFINLWSPKDITILKIIWIKLNWTFFVVIIHICIKYHWTIRMHCKKISKNSTDFVMLFWMVFQSYHNDSQNHYSWSLGDNPVLG